MARHEAKLPDQGPFERQTEHVATRDVPGLPTVGDFRAMFGGTRIPNNARVFVDRVPALPEPTYRITAKWSTR